MVCIRSIRTYSNFFFLQNQVDGFVGKLSLENHLIDTLCVMKSCTRTQAASRRPSLDAPAPPLGPTIGPYASSYGRVLGGRCFLCARYTQAAARRPSRVRLRHSLDELEGVSKESMSLKYEPSSEPLHVYVKGSFLHGELY